MTKLVNILKKPLALNGLLGVLLTSSIVYADVNPKFYVGAGIDYADYGVPVSEHQFVQSNGTTVMRVRTKRSGFGLVAPIMGVKFNEKFGLEAGYSFNKKLMLQLNNMYNNQQETAVLCKVKNAYVDLMGYMPLTEKVELIAGIGLGRFFAKKGAIFEQQLLVPQQEIKCKGQLGLRLKAGTQYNVNQNLGVRALVSFQYSGVKAEGFEWPSYDGKNRNKLITNMVAVGLAATYTL